MTGRELMIYILEHHLEDKPVFDNGVFIGYMTVGKFAEEIGYGTQSVLTMIQLGHIDGAIKIGDEYLIPEYSLLKYRDWKEQQA